jgi:hypothetical protein
MTRIKMTECAICLDAYNEARDHCPTCGAKRIFLGSGRAVVFVPLSYEDSSRAVQVSHRCAADTTRTRVFLAPMSLADGFGYWEHVNAGCEVIERVQVGSRELVRAYRSDIAFSL